MTQSSAREDALAHQAVECLAAAARSAKHPKRAFSSDLSVDEAVAISEVGYGPLGLVMGSAIFHVGYSFVQMNQNAEIGQLSEAMRLARETAIGRLEFEAGRLDATGVVGVRLEIGTFEPRQHLLEFTAIGTAVAPTGGRAAQGRSVGRPFASDLSGQDFAALVRAGYEPVGIALGSCVYHVAYQGMASFRMNGEMQSYTEAVYAAREAAMARLQSEAARAGAHGVVGVKVEEHAHAWGSHAIEFFAVGTAVRLAGGSHRTLEPRMVVPTDDLVRLADGSLATEGDQGRA
jgi:uncharacterized protein YbjQ (UPF0145 family)